MLCCWDFSLFLFYVHSFFLFFVVSLNTHTNTRYLMMGRSVQDFFWPVWFIFVVGFHFPIFAAYSVTVHYYSTVYVLKKSGPAGPFCKNNKIQNIQSRMTVLNQKLAIRNAIKKVTNHSMQKQSTKLTLNTNQESPFPPTENPSNSKLLVICID